MSDSSVQTLAETETLSAAPAVAEDKPKASATSNLASDSTASDALASGNAEAAQAETTAPTQTRLFEKKHVLAVVKALGLPFEGEDALAAFGKGLNGSIVGEAREAMIKEIDETGKAAASLSGLSQISLGEHLTAEEISLLDSRLQAQKQAAEAQAGKKPSKEQAPPLSMKELQERMAKDLNEIVGDKLEEYEQLGKKMEQLQKEQEAATQKLASATKKSRVLTGLAALGGIVISAVGFRGSARGTSTKVGIGAALTLGLAGLAKFFSNRVLKKPAAQKLEHNQAEQAAVIEEGAKLEAHINEAFVDIQGRYLGSAETANTVPDTEKDQTAFAKKHPSKAAAQTVTKEQQPRTFVERKELADLQPVSHMIH